MHYESIKLYNRRVKDLKLKIEGIEYKLNHEYAFMDTKFYNDGTKEEETVRVYNYLNDKFIQRLQEFADKFDYVGLTKIKKFA